MASVFTKIIRGELPGRFVYKDEDIVAFLTTSPVRYGHTLVVPRQEVDHWLDLPQELSARLFSVSQTVGHAIQQALSPVKVGLIIAGLEVRHVHVHLMPIHDLTDLEFARQNHSPDPAELDRSAKAIRGALTSMGFSSQAQA